MAKYKITPELNLKKIITESRELAETWNEFVDNLEQIEKKYECKAESEVSDQMQIVIHISKEIYQNVLNGTYCGTLYEALKNGTPLPEEHGRLIVEPTEEEIAKVIGGKSDFAEFIRESVKAVFDNAPTIVGADRSDKDD